MIYAQIEMHYRESELNNTFEYIKHIRTLKAKAKNLIASSYNQL